ncbi:helix-turn-helix domain-containing protein [Ramlibacter sp.]|uniref:helix-turn-helix domain-containing protein n=1 Tax=Ramlibacter sp. TaxID=1917967 RepID=UPI003D0A0F44
MHPAVESAVAPIRVVRSSRTSSRSAEPAPLRTQCSTCHLRELCLPCGLGGPDVERLDGLRFARRKVKAGSTLYRSGEKFGFIYAVRSGSFKSVLALPDGREHVTGFQLPGELLGLDGAANGSHASGAAALEDSEVCAIPYAHLSDLAIGSTEMQQVLSRMMSREIVREHSLMMLLGSMNAEERLAAFLLNVSQRMKARGYSPREFHLRMSRAEIGSLLGMKLETVSRTFSAFQQQGLLDVDKKHVRIVDIDALSRILEARVQ